MRRPRPALSKYLQMVRAQRLKFSESWLEAKPRVFTYVHCVVFP